MPKILSQAQIDQFWREGCVYPVRVMSEADAIEIRRKLEQFEAESGGPLRISRARYTDARGRLYSAGPSYALSSSGVPSSSDSAPILRLDRATKKTDTVAFIKVPPVSVSTSGGGSNVAVRAGGGNPYVATDTGRSRRTAASR